MNQSYKYNPLDRTKREIRLVRIKGFVEVTAFIRDPIASDLLERDDVFRAMIEKDFPMQCSIEHASLDDKPPYIALSYTWGDPTNKKPIHVTNEDGTVTTLQVTQNLYAALRHIRPDLLPNIEDDALLWIDAICINQTDEYEKSWQVQQMLYIYRNALNLLVFLGSRTDGSAEFMDEMDASFNKYTTWVRGHQNVDINHWDLNKEVNNLLGAASFVHQPYWRRVWIQQEIYAKPFVNEWLQWGQKIINLTKVYVFMVGLKNLYTTLRRQELQSLVSSSLIAADLRLVMESHEYEMVLQTIYRTHDSDEAHDSLTLVNLLGIIHVVGYGLQAFDPRDHIFGVLNMAADVESLGLVPDYTQSSEKVFIEAATALIKKGEIVILGWANAFGSGPPSIESTVSKLPSWVPDWRLPISSSIGAFTQFFTTVQIQYRAGRQRSLCTARFVDSKKESDVPTMSSYGVEIDTVLSLSKVLTRERSQSSNSSTDESQSSLEKSDQITGSPRGDQLLRSQPQGHWFEELENLISLDKTTQESPWDLRDTVWRVPVGDIELTAEGEYKRASHAFKNGYSLLHDRFMQPDTTKCHTNEEKLLASRFWEIMDAQSLGRRYFITKKGYIGLGPEALAPGDLAVVLLALNTPLILRPVEEGHCRIVGEAYVNGMMDGQAFEGDYKLREFLID